MPVVIESVVGRIGRIQHSAYILCGDESVDVQLNWSNEGVLVSGAGRKKALDHLGLQDDKMRAELMKNDFIFMPLEFKSITQAHEAAISQARKEYTPKQVSLIVETTEVRCYIDEYNELGDECAATVAIQERVNALAKKIGKFPHEILAPFQTEIDFRDYSIDHYFKAEYDALLIHLEGFRLQEVEADEAKAAKEAEKQAARQAIFDEAARTDKPQVIEKKTYITPHWKEGEIYETITRLAMPDGTEKTTTTKTHML